MNEEEIVLAHEQREREERWLEELWGISEEEVANSPRAASAASALEEQREVIVSMTQEGLTTK